MTIIKDMPERDYHAHPALSSTQARQLLESPAKYKWRLDHPMEARAAFDVGTAAHTKILGVGAGIITYPDEHLTASGAVSTKAATVLWAEEQRAAGLTPVSPGQAEAVDAMAEAVLAHDDARALLEQPGTPEASVFATCPETGVEVRSRFDFLADSRNGRRLNVDVKTTAGSADTHGFAKSAATYGYDVQRGHYLDTLKFATGEEDAEILFVVVEKAGPYLVSVHRLDEQFAEMGAEKAWKARQTLARCRERNEWPGYTTGVQSIQPPMWLIYDHQDRYGDVAEIRI